MKSTFFKYSICLFISLVVAFSVLGQDSNNLVLSDLRCRNSVNPLAVDYPLFSWKIRTNMEGASQKGYELEIASTNDQLVRGKADIWKSGKQNSDEQFNIEPCGAIFSEATSYFWRVRISDNHGQVSPWSKPATFSTGLKDQSWKAKWITYENSIDSAAPYFRKIFNIDQSKAVPVQAMIYLCGLGCSELYINGRMVDSTRFLDPAQTNYEQYALYTTFNVTRLLHKGDNCLGIMLGKGWFTQDIGWGGSAGFSYGNPMLRVQLVVLYSDGTRNIMGSDESWVWKGGPVVMSNLYLGENYDARREIKNWCRADAHFTDWKPVLLVKDNIPPRLVPQIVEPIRKKQLLKALKMWQDTTGNWIFDFGVNCAGIPRLKIEQPKGTHLTIRIAEEKKANGNLDFTSLGWINHGKIFADEYICKGGGGELWSPRFTYHGFRYAELSGLKGKPDLTTMSMIIVYSDLTKSGTFECADPQINHLHELAIRTVLSNLHGIPTDCPNREKCGWLGDSHSYVKMANLNLQMDNFWMKYLEDIRSGANYLENKTLFHERYNSTFYFTEKLAGLPYMIAPGKRLCGVASPDWGTALVQLPWWLYVYYGNKKALNDFYPNMKQWTDYVSSLANDTARTNKYSNKTKHIVYQGLGDWCPPGGNGAIDTPIEFTSTAFHYLDVTIMEKVATLLGKKEDAQIFAKEKKSIAKEVLINLYNAQQKTFGSQTADAMALDFGLVPKGDEKEVADAMVRNMKVKYGGFMHCGIFGITRIGSMLARNGNSEAAWKMVTCKRENSFEWMWSTADATSLWEVLPVNTKSEKEGYQGSHNHPMQAGYDVAFYEDMAGIRPDDSGYGFKVIRFDPLFTANLKWAKGSIESPYGTVSSRWKNEAGKFDWKIKIPANSTGLVALPKGKNITVNGIPLNLKKYQLVKGENGNNIYQFPSGNFNIQTL